MFLINDKVKQHIDEHQLELHWPKLLYVCAFMVGGFIVAPLYVVFHGFHAGPFILLFILYWVSGLPITMGYHRLFAHRTFKTNKVIEALLLLASTMGLQDTALQWASDHRTHHNLTDTDGDPYNSSLGFWWAHMLWIFYPYKRERNSRLTWMTDTALLSQEFPNCLDLVNNPLIRLQHTTAIPCGFFLTFGIPALCGLYFGEFWSYILVAGFLRGAIVHQFTFSINSLAHIMGTQPYTDRDTSRDSLILALITAGEGYHNYHHAYPTDYRNGAKLYHFDPTKWLIAGLSYLGLTWDLKRPEVGEPTVEAPVTP